MNLTVTVEFSSMLEACGIWHANRFQKGHKILYFCAKGLEEIYTCDEMPKTAEI